MFNWKEFARSKQVLSHFGGNRYREEMGQHHLTIRPRELLDWIEFLKEDLGYFTLCEIAGWNRTDETYEFEIVYHLLNMGTHQRVNIHVLVNSGERVPSLGAFLPHADWMEREQCEMLDLPIDRDSRSLLLPEGQDNFPLRVPEGRKLGPWPVENAKSFPELRTNPNKSEAPYPEERYQWKSFDLFSPITHGNFEWQVCFDPQKVVDSRVRVGFHHQGFELLAQDRSLSHILQLTDKLNLSSAPTFSTIWAKTVEDAYRIKIPERAQALRIVLLELARIADHLTMIATVCIEAKQSEFRIFIDAREKIYELFEKFCGHRQGLGIIAIGGVKEDLPYGWIVEYQTAIELILKNLKVVHLSLLSQKRFRSLTEGDPVSAQSILQLGVSGPAMRAAGLNFDLRKSQPFYFYQDIDFDVPIGIQGSVYDRYLIRIEEIHQSARIITQVIDNLPLGETLSSQYNRDYFELESLFKELEVPQSWNYSSLEAPNGEAGFLVKFGVDAKPRRIKVKTPSFTLVQGLNVFMKGLREEQLSIGVLSLGLSRWEIDR